MVFSRVAIPMINCNPRWKVNMTLTFVFDGYLIAFDLDSLLHDPMCLNFKYLRAFLGLQAIFFKGEIHGFYISGPTIAGRM
jgi:hypothetical protein